MTRHTINGVPIEQCSPDALYREYMAGLRQDAQIGLTEEQEAKLIAIESLLPRCNDGEGVDKP